MRERSTSFDGRTLGGSDSSADTYGWDTVFAISYADVNRAIAAKKSSPTKFKQEVTDEGDKIAIEGTFADWQVAVGGDGQNLWMDLPIPTVTLSGISNGSYTNAVASIEVKLGLIPQQGATPKKGQQALRIAQAARGDKTVTVREVDLGEGGSKMKAGFVAMALEAWLNANAVQFAHTFASVDLDRELADELKGMAWLMPTHTSYAVSDLGNAESSVFGVLSMTEDREPTRLNHQVSANAIPDHARAGFLISRERFLEKMVLPSMPALFKGATLDDFFVGDDGASVLNNKRITVQGLKLDDGTVVNPSLDTNNLSVSVSETRLTITFTDLHFVYSPGIDVYIQYTAENVLGIDADKRISLKLRKTTHKGAVTTSLDKQIIEIASTIAGIVIGAVIGVVVPGGAEVEEGAVTAGETAANAVIEESTVLLEEADNEVVGIAEDGVSATKTAGQEAAGTLEANSSATSKFAGWFARNSAKIRGGLIGSTIGGAVGGIAGKIPDILEAVANGEVKDLPTLERFASAAVQPISWPGQSKFTLTSAALNHSMQLGCHPGFADT